MNWKLIIILLTMISCVGNTEEKKKMAGNDPKELCLKGNEIFRIIELIIKSEECPSCEEVVLFSANSRLGLTYVEELKGEIIIRNKKIQVRNIKKGEKINSARLELDIATCNLLRFKLATGEKDYVIKGEVRKEDQWQVHILDIIEIN